MKHNRFSPKTLIAFLALGLLVSCGSDDGGETVTNDTTGSGTSKTTEPIVTEAVPDTDGLDFGGAEIRTITPDWSSFVYYFPEAQTGESLDDAAYNRIKETEGTLNIKIVNTYDNAGTSLARDLQKTIQAGEDAYDMAFTHPIDGISALVTNNMLLNLDSLPYVDFEKPWWNRKLIDRFRIGDETYYATGDIILQNPYIMHFNKTIAAEFDMPDHYETVKNGDWTFDLFLEQTKAVSVDMDGDGKMTGKDKVGIAGDMTEALSNIPFGCGLTLTKSTADSIALTMYSDKFVELFYKTYDLLTDNTVSQIYFRNTEDVKQLFSDNLSLFTISKVDKMTQLRDYDVDFGVLPMPKYDKEQEDYISLVWASFVCVPTTVTRPEIVGAVLEQFAYESGDVQDAYMEDLIRGKTTRDEASLEMLDIIYGNMVCDIGLNYLGFSPAFQNGLYCFNRLIDSDNRNVTSFYEKYEDKMIAELDELYESILENQAQNK